MSKFSIIPFVTMVAVQSGMLRATVFDMIVNLWPEIKVAEEGDVLTLDIEAKAKEVPGHELLPHLLRVNGDLPKVEVVVRFFS